MRIGRRSLMLLGWLAVAASLVAVPANVDGDGAPTSGGSSGKAEDADYTAAVKAIKANDFASAIRLLNGVVARDARNADAYNWLGYATRRNGDAKAAVPIYQKALALDPKHRGAHEYIGEAYLTLDDPAKAKQHLATLNSLCFLPCSEYTDLKKAVEAYEKSGGKLKPKPTAAN